MGMKLNMGHQCALLAKKANNILSSLRMSTDSRLREILIPLQPGNVSLNLESFDQFWVSKYKKYVSILERVQSRVTKIF